MKKLLAVALLLIPIALHGKSTKQEVTAWEQQAKRVTIVRDDWGIAHIHGKTDADAVFGMIYAQAEDDFSRIERNYLLSIGRLAEAEGERQIWKDLRMRMFVDPAEMEAKYRKSPKWLRALMDSWAAGLNFYLHKHPEVKPKVLDRFEPWMALTFSEGSIGGDIEQIGLEQIEAFYGKPRGADVSSAPRVVPELRADETSAPFIEPGGSNGIAIAPSISATHHALLLINPHTSFYFRSELQMSSDEGLDAYGAVTWGQFFVYQGFNPHCGWMHTSSGVDNIDAWLEKVKRKDDRFVYEYDGKERNVTSRSVVIRYRNGDAMVARKFTLYFTHHGPIVGEREGRWIAVGLMQDPIHTLMQSYGRTKATDLASFREWLDLHTNSSNNTVFADSSGNIAYFHSNFIPKRDPNFDWRKPVDGSIPETEWRGVLSFDETPNVINPKVGWVYNSNNWPWSAAGPDSPKRSDYPSYVERGERETPRGDHMLRVLTGKKDLTLDSLLAAAFDSDMPAFDRLLPPLFRDYDAEPAGSPIRERLAGPIDLLRNWARRWSANSLATSLAIFWAEDLGHRVEHEAISRDEIAALKVTADVDGTIQIAADQYAATMATPDERFASLQAATEKLIADFGNWKTPWGEINRFQRLDDSIEPPHFDDAKPSIPVPFVSSRWGSLASFNAKAYPGTKRWYGIKGNSFVAVVEFGDRVRARAVTAGGESGKVASSHFIDEADRYASGNLRQVYFYPEQLKRHSERTYHPGG